MSRRWRRSLADLPVREHDDRARLEAIIAQALAEDARKSPITPRVAGGYEGSKKDSKDGGHPLNVR